MVQSDFSVRVCCSGDGGGVVLVAKSSSVVLLGPDCQSVGAGQVSGLGEE